MYNISACHFSTVYNTNTVKPKHLRLKVWGFHSDETRDCEFMSYITQYGRWLPTFRNYLHLRDKSIQEEWTVWPWKGKCYDLSKRPEQLTQRHNATS